MPLSPTNGGGGGGGIVFPCSKTSKEYVQFSCDNYIRMEFCVEPMKSLKGEDREECIINFLLE